MTEVFRKHYSYGETIPIIDTHVGMTTDVFEVTGKPAPVGPFIKAVCTATAGPMKSLPLVVEPLQSSDSKVVHLTNIPVPIAGIRTIDMSLIFDFVNYRWTPSQESPQNNGLVTFDLRLRTAFSLLGKSYTLQLDQRPCAITLTKAHAQAMQPPLAGISNGFDRQQQNVPYGQQEQSEFGQAAYGVSEQRGTVDAESERSSYLTKQLDIEERLRELSTKLLTRT